MYLLKANLRMKYLEIKNIGPITNTGVMQVSPVTVVCGGQGSGKSTIVKVLSSCMWLEKSIMKRLSSKDYYTKYNRFKNHLLGYHQIDDFIRPDSYIKYIGEAYTIEYKDGHLSIGNTRGGQEYLLPKVMYIPAERNFMVAIERADRVRNLPPSLVTLQEEYLKALNGLKGSFGLIDDFFVEYSRQNKIAYITKGESKVRVHKGASGLQSLIPLLLVSRHLSSNISSHKGVSLSAEEWDLLRKNIESIRLDKGLTEEVKKIMIEDISKVVAPKCMWCIVEEPEQNLYPTSQKEMLFALLRDRALNRGSGLILTTHSPYIINYLAICVKAYQVAKMVSEEGCNSVAEVVPPQSLLDPDDIRIYEINNQGIVEALETYEGIPSDSNFLNTALNEANQLYGRLLDIEEEYAREGQLF